MRMRSAILALVGLLLIGFAPLSAQDKKDAKDNSQDRLPGNIEWKVGPLYQTFDVQSLRYVPGRSVTWKVIAQKEVKKFKGIMAVLTDEDSAGAVKVKLEFSPNNEEYKKGDKIEVTFRFPDQKTFERTAKVVFSLIN